MTRYNPTPSQKKHQLYAGTTLVIVGAATFIAGLIDPNAIATLVGGILAAGGQLMRAYAQ